MPAAGSCQATAPPISVSARAQRLVEDHEVGHGSRCERVRRAQQAPRGADGGRQRRGPAASGGVQQRRGAGKRRCAAGQVAARDRGPRGRRWSPAARPACSVPAGAPAAATASLTATRRRPAAPASTDSVGLATCTPSQITAMWACRASRNAPTGPGARAVRPGMALNACTSSRAPRRDRPRAQFGVGLGVADCRNDAGLPQCRDGGESAVQLGGERHDAGPERFDQCAQPRRFGEHERVRRVCAGAPRRQERAFQVDAEAAGAELGPPRRGERGTRAPVGRRAAADERRAERGDPVGRERRRHVGDGHGVVGDLGTVQAVDLQVPEPRRGDPALGQPQPARAATRARGDRPVADVQLAVG